MTARTNGALNVFKNTTMKNPFSNYSKDSGAKIGAIFITGFLIMLTLASPSYWWVFLLAGCLYAGLFYVMRNNP